MQTAEQAIKEIKEKFGKEAVTYLVNQPRENIPHIPTGIYSLDNYVLGVGGLPRGRIIEILGTEGAGKTTVALNSISSAQSMGLKTAYIDAEHALNPKWAVERVGVDLGKLLVSQPDSGNQALQICERLIDSGAFGMVVVDSVAALVPQAELDGEVGDAVMGAQARMMSQACRKFAAIVSKTDTCMVFINQLRMNIGGYGNPEVTTGGRALRFYASIRLDVRRAKHLKEGEVITGQTVKVKAIKNKVSPPYRETEFDLLFDKGIDKLGNLIDQAIIMGVIEKSGSWYSYKGVRLGQGKAAAVEYIVANKLIGEVNSILCQQEERRVA